MMWICIGWDLECNKVIRSYHGHLSGVFSLKLHPTLDVLITGGRDAVARVSTSPSINVKFLFVFLHQVWDMRSKQQIHVLSGHHGTVWSLETQGTDPQVITGSADSTIKVRVYCLPPRMSNGNVWHRFSCGILRLER